MIVDSYPDPLEDDVGKYVDERPVLLVKSTIMICRTSELTNPKHIDCFA